MTVSSTDRLREIRDELAAMLGVRPPMRMPYLKGLHGRDVVTRAITAIDAALAEVSRLDAELARLRLFVPNITCGGCQKEHA